MKYLVIILGIIILLLLGVIIYKNHQYNKLQVQTTEKPVFRDVLQKSDKNGNKYVEIPQQRYTQDQLNKITDSVRRVYKISKIVGQVQTITKIDTISTETIIYIDTANHTIYSQDSNRFIKQSFLGNSSTHIGHFTLSLTPDTLTYIDAVRYKIFKANEHSIILNHTNEYFTTIAGNAITLKERRVNFVLGPAIQASYNPFTGKWFPSIGFSCTYNLIPIYTK